MSIVFNINKMKRDGIEKTNLKMNPKQRKTNQKKENHN
jgi:hypothetical protein